MLIWINGAFGVGKSKVAKEIAKLRPAAYIFDPEQIGFMLRRVLPEGRIDDFRELALWRKVTGEVLAAIALEVPERLIVVPMTMTNPLHLAEIIGKSRDRGVQVHHFTLTASPETVRRRLGRRLDWPRSRRWALARVEENVSALADDAFLIHVPADDRPPKALATDILNQSQA